jgi:ribonucleotide reductase alpha subunit
MIETVIQLNGEREPFDAKKLNHWVQDTVGKIKIKDWSEIAQETIAELPSECTVQELMSSLIDKFLKRETWTHYLLAGKLMAVLIRIEIFGSKQIPTIREVQRRLAEKKLMRPLNYSEYEWAALEDIIDHDQDLVVPHFALEQVRLKYSLQDFAEKLEFETMQFVYMRMAMTIFETHPESPQTPTWESEPGKRSRLEHVARMYNHFAKKRLSAPTPNYNNLGTYHRGFASCCLIAAGDDRFSLAAADHITYMMTTQSAGIGLNIMCRSIGDAVQKGRFLHRGKKPYIDVFGKNIRANLQGGRGGAGTFYANLYDPEARMIFGLRDTRAVETKRNRDAHYAFMSNRFLTMKAANEEMVFAWNCYTAPELHEAFYSGDIHKFAEIYTRLEADENFEKVYFDARELLLFALTQGLSTGTIYAASIDEMNRNTPFIDAIHSSNLCVAPGTLIHTRKGAEAISVYQDRYVEIWNGFEWSGVTVRKTSDCEKLVRVYVNHGKGYLDCTLYHKWYIIGPGGIEKEVRTHELKKGMFLADFFEINDPTTPINARILDIEDLGVENSTYCFNEPKRHKAMFNGIVTGQCLEVSEPTMPYEGRDAMKDLQSSEEVGHAIFEATDTNGKVIRFGLKASDVLKPIAGQKWVAQTVKVGNKFWTETDGTLTVSNVISVKKEPEVALCSLASINVTDEISEDEYRDVMYYAYKMIDYCIMENDYILAHMGVTAKARMNAGVGMMGLATHMARKRLKFNEKAGLEELHRVFERHLYYAIEASLEISKERGLAPWINRTKWPEGWTPLQTYRKEVDKLADFVYQYDHEEQRQRIIANGGLAHSCLINFMPGESSSKALGATNSIYGIRKPIMIKTDANNVLRWAAPYGDDPAYEYQSMWQLSLLDQNSVYALAQKFCDQTVSADWYMDFTNRVVIRSSDLLDAEIDRVKKGVKTRYYVNILMPETDDAMKISKSAHDYAWQVFSDAFRKAYEDALAKEFFAGSIVDFAEGIAGLQEQIVASGHDWAALADEAGMVLSVLPSPEDLVPSEANVVHDGQAELVDEMAALGIVFEDENEREVCEGCSS